MPVLLFMPTRIISAYFSWLVIRDSADDQPGVCTITLTEYVFMSGTISVTISRHMDGRSYYSLNPRLDNLSGSILFQLPDESFDALKYFGLYKFALRMGTDSVIMTMAFHRCVEVNSGRTAI